MLHRLITKSQMKQCTLHVIVVIMNAFGKQVHGHLIIINLILFLLINTSPIIMILSY